MHYWIALVFGALQGLAEFIPISSSGHLVLIRHIFEWPDQGLAFDAVLHLGTLLAVFIALYKEWWRVLKGFFSFVRTGKLWSTPEQRFFSALIIASIPAALVGFFLESWVDDNFRGLLSLGLFFAATGSFYFFVELVIRTRLEDKKAQQSVGFRRALWIGLAQIAALWPGVSRSGMTMTAGMLTGMSRRRAARFAFLLSGPIVAGAGALSVYRLVSGAANSSATNWGPLLLGSLVALIVGWLSIKGMLKFLRTKTLKPFAVYLLVLGILIVGLRFFGVLN